MGSGIERLDPRSIQQQLAEFRLGEPTSEDRRPHIDLIVAATTSARRLSLIRFVAEGLPVISISIGEDEPETTKPEKVVRDKLARGIIIVEAERGRTIPENFMVALFAADTLSAPIALDKNGQIILKPQSKPFKEGQVRRVFRQMEEFAVTTDDDPTYSVSSASGVVLVPSRDMKPFIPQPLEAKIKLGREFVAWINHSGGFEKYRERIAQDASILESASMYHIAAGLSIPVLKKMGGAVSINGKTVDDPSFENEFLSAVSVAGAGVHQEVARFINPNADLRNWSFPHRMADYALRERAA